MRNQAGFNESENTQQLENEDSKSAMLVDQKEKLVNRTDSYKQTSISRRRDTPEV